MIIVTGGAGFIGSQIIKALNEKGHDNIIIVDRLREKEKWKNLISLNYQEYFDKDEFLHLFREEEFCNNIATIFHMGACSSTTETNADYLMHNNFLFTKFLAQQAFKYNIRLIYASSAATYGDGSQGYSDEVDLNLLKPLNMYGYSKHIFDEWAYRNQLYDNSKITGLKFFNVYGPNEYHKENMRSVVHKAYEQIQQTGKVELFKSHLPNCKDGEQKRDFIYVQDVVKIALFFMENPEISGLYNVGTGQAQSFNELVKAVFDAMEKETRIEYIDMPKDLQNKYQYHTEADITKLRKAGYNDPLFSLEDGIFDYITKYL